MSGPIELAGDVVAGGWGAVSNIIRGIGQGAESLISPFFPSSQKHTPTKSDIVAPMGTAGTIYRQVDPENPSMNETNFYARNDWIGSPYALNLAPATKKAESQSLAESVSTTRQGPVDTIYDVVKGGIESGIKIKTLADEFMRVWNLKPREPISEGPREIGNSPGVVVNMQSEGGRQADVLIERGKNIIDQIKGFFSVGYEAPTGDQPVHDIEQNITPGKIPAKTLAVVGVIAAIYFLG